MIAPLPMVLGIVAAQRVAELAYATRNTRRLLARGAIEIAPEQHRYFVALHVAWLAAMAILIPLSTPPKWLLLAVFFLLQAARLWTVASLGPYWTTRIMTLPGVPLVRSGPYRFVRHPNYAIVVLEIAILPLAFGSAAIALVFSAANAALLRWRIVAEERALESRRRGAG